MKELLEKIILDLAREKSTSHEDILKRIDELKSYLHTLDKVSSDILKIKDEYTREIQPLLAEKSALVSDIEELKKQISSSKASWDKDLAEKTKHLNSLKEEISVKESKLASLEKNVSDLILEGKNSQSRSEELRSEMLTLERNFKELKSSVIEIDRDISAKKAEESGLTSLIENKKAELSKLYSDIKILESRKK